MKCQRIQQNQLSTGWLQGAEDQHKPLTHPRGNVWQQEVPATQLPINLKEQFSTIEEKGFSACCTVLQQHCKEHW